MTMFRGLPTPPFCLSNRPAGPSDSRGFARQNGKRPPGFPGGLWRSTCENAATWVSPAPMNRMTMMTTYAWRAERICASNEAWSSRARGDGVGEARIRRLEAEILAETAAVEDDVERLGALGVCAVGRRL